MDRDAPSLGDLPALSTLGDPTRRRLYEYVATAAGPVGRDEAAAAVGVARSLAAYHLDKLAEHGLVEVGYARPEGRGGPGAGRPAKHYRRAEREFALQAPPRDYSLLADVLLRATEEIDDPEVPVAIERAAHALGAELGR